MKWLGVLLGMGMYRWSAYRSSFYFIFRADLLLTHCMSDQLYNLPTMNRSLPWPLQFTFEECLFCLSSACGGLECRSSV